MTRHKVVYATGQDYRFSVKVPTEDEISDFLGEGNPQHRTTTDLPSDKPEFVRGYPRIAEILKNGICHVHYIGNFRDILTGRKNRLASMLYGQSYYGNIIFIAEFTDD